MENERPPRIELKPGDIVRLIQHDKYSIRQGWDIGDEAVVIIGNHSSGRAYWVTVRRTKDGMEESYYPDCFELAIPREIPVFESNRKARFQLGDKVSLPKTKSIGGSLDISSIIRRAKEKNQDFLYVVGIDDAGNGVYTLSDSMNDENDGDWFSFDDVTDYLNLELPVFE